MRTPPLSVESSCFRDSFSGDAFKFGLTVSKQSFEEGETLCRQLFRGDAASIHSEAENQAIIDLFLNEERPIGTGVWMGLKDPVGSGAANDAQRFAWVDGTSFDFGNLPNASPWFTFEPNNEGLNENCVELVSFNVGVIGWNDKACNAQSPMICRFACNTPSPTSKPTASPSPKPSSLFHPTSTPSATPTSSPSTTPTLAPFSFTSQATAAPSLSPTGVDVSSDGGPPSKLPQIYMLTGSAITVVLLMLALVAMLKRRRYLNEVDVIMTNVAKSPDERKKHLSGLRVSNFTGSIRFTNLLPRSRMFSSRRGKGERDMSKYVSWDTIDSDALQTAELGENNNQLPSDRRPPFASSRIRANRSVNLAPNFSEMSRMFAFRRNRGPDDRSNHLSMETRCTTDSTISELPGQQPAPSASKTVKYQVEF